MKTKSNQLNKLLTIAFMTLGLSVAASRATAQSADNMKTAEERAVKLSDKMKTELSLTDEQYEKVKAVNLKYAQKNEDILKGDGGKLAKLKSVKASQKSKKKEMKEILTKEQFAKYEQMMEDAETEAKERFKSRNG